MLLSRYVLVTGGRPTVQLRSADPSFVKGANAKSHLIVRSGLLDEFFKDVSNPGFFSRPLHSDPLPSPSQVKIDVKETPSASALVAEVAGVAQEGIRVTVEGNVVKLCAEVKPQDR